MSLFKKSLIFFVFILLYIVSAVPVGLFIYSLKSSNGIDVFSKTGFHSYMYCLKEEAKKIGSD